MFAVKSEETMDAFCRLMFHIHPQPDISWSGVSSDQQQSSKTQPQQPEWSFRRWTDTARTMGTVKEIQNKLEGMAVRPETPLFFQRFLLFFFHKYSYLFPLVALMRWITWPKTRSSCRIKVASRKKADSLTWVLTPSGDFWGLQCEAIISNLNMKPSLSHSFSVWRKDLIRHVRF